MALFLTYFFSSWAKKRTSSMIWHIDCDVKIDWKIMKQDWYLQQCFPYFVQIFGISFSMFFFWLKRKEICGKVWIDGPLSYVFFSSWTKKRTSSIIYQRFFQSIGNIDVNLSHNDFFFDRTYRIMAIDTSLKKLCSYVRFSQFWPHSFS